MLACTHAGEVLVCTPAKGVISKMQQRPNDRGHLSQNEKASGVETKYNTDGGQPTDPFRTRFEPSPSNNEGVADGSARKIGDRYEILSEIGRGGMGIVYRAHDRHRNQTVALKTLQWIDPAALYRFKQEFRTLSDISHRNLVTLYELFSDGQQWCFTMELISGQSLQKHIRARGEASEIQYPILRDALKQLTEGVAHLHAAGKLHRDIKPQNTIVANDGRLVLLDFGLAAELQSTGMHQSTERHVVGTFAYMSPEQAAALPVTPASDWYSVGVTLYQLLTGKLPFSGSMYDVLRDKQLSEPTPPVELNPATPADLNQLCMGLLRRQPNDRLRGEDVLSALGTGTVSKGVDKRDSAPTSASSSRPLIGRQSHLQALRDSLDLVSEGHPVVVSLPGRSGSGKTALLHCFLDELETAPDTVVLRGRCYEQESMPFKTLDNLMDALSRYLSHLPSLEVQALLPRDMGPLRRLFPVLGRVEAVNLNLRGLEIPDPQELRRRAVSSLRELLGRIGDRRRLVLAVDDLQWGDADSASIFGDLFSPPDPPSLLLACAFRSEDYDQGPLRAALDVFFEKTKSTVIRRTVNIESLSADETKQLAVSLLTTGGDSVRRQVDGIVRESSGNPLFVHELARWIEQQEGEVRRTEFSLDDLLFRRSQALPKQSRRLLEVVAVAGRPLSQNDAFRAAGFTAEQADALARLRTERLLRTTGSGENLLLETFHDRVREALSDRLPKHRLYFHHKRLAAELEHSSVVDPEEIARHFESCGEFTRAGAFYLRAADDAAQALAFNRAAQLYRKVLSIAVVDGATQSTLRTKLGNALANAGHGVSAAEAYVAAAELATSSDAVKLRQDAALQLLISGHVDDGLELLKTSLTSVGIPFPRTSRTALLKLVGNHLLFRIRGVKFRALPAADVPESMLRRIDACWAAVAGLSCVDTVRAAYFQSRHMLLSLSAREPLRVMRALALQIGHEVIAGQAVLHRTNRLAAVAESLRQDLQDPYADALMLWARTLSAGLCGHYCNCVKFADQSDAIFRGKCIGVGWEMDTLHRFSTWALTYRGQFAELNRRIPELLKEARAQGNLYAETNLTTFVIPALNFAADDVTLARNNLHDSMRCWSQQGFHVQHLTRVHDEATIELYAGNAGHAIAALERSWPDIRKSQLLRVCQLRIFLHDLRARSTLSQAACTTSRDGLLHSALEDAKKLAKERDDWAQPLAWLIRAGVATARGRQDLSIPDLRNVIQECDRLDMSLHAAVARCRLARLIGGDEGKSIEKVALDWMSEQGIKNWPRICALIAPGFSE